MGVAQPAGHEWPYQRRWGTMVAAFAFFGAAALFLGHQASTNTRALIFDLIPFPAPGATAFYWALSGLSLAVTAFALLLVIVRFRGEGKRRLVITQKYIMLPLSLWHDQLLTIDYRAVRSLSVRTVSRRGPILRSKRARHRILQLDCTSRRYSISSSQLPSDETFDEVCALIAARVPGARGDSRQHTVR